MPRPGTPEQPLRVAIVGSGPTGFYAAQHLFNNDGLNVEVDMFDRLPTPFGLVRLGVAPDHQKIKSVTAVYHKVAGTPGFRFFGNVELGRHVTVADLRRHYHQIVYCTGAQTDRRLGVPGEDLDGSYTATEFVAWYNGHPDFGDRKFDLSREVAVVVGVGNVAVDVARILCRSLDELAKTDIADYALAALRESKVREVHVLGRRGPAQAAFTNAEIKELGALPGVDTLVRPDEAETDALSLAALEKNPDKMTARKLDIIKSFGERGETGQPKKLVLRFLVSPTEIVGDAGGRVAAVKLVRNELYEGERGKLLSRPTGHTETLDAGLVFRSVGYRGVALPGVPFREDWAIIPNEAGRVLAQPGGQALAGEYCAGWIKRGPQGVIGTNKPDALETVRCMLEDVEAERTLRPEAAGAAAALALIRERQPAFVSYDDWIALDKLETSRGEASGRPRVKFTEVGEMLAALGKG